jgi:hypothetical protein
MAIEEPGQGKPLSIKMQAKVKVKALEVACSKGSKK